MATKETLSQGEIESILNEIEAKMQRLRTAYEQYFVGVERMPPTTMRKDVFTLVLRVENLYIQNTAQKFRSRSLIQRFNSYKTYWTRIERQIEEGTYQRDINRANRRSVRQREQADGQPIVELDLDMDLDLQEIQLEFEELEAAGAFDKPKHVREPVVPARNEPARAEISDAEREAIKQRKLEELRRQLLGGDAFGEAPAPAPQPRPQPVQTTQPAPQPVAQVAEPSGPVDERQAKLDRLKQRLGGPHRVAEPAAHVEPPARVIERQPTQQPQPQRTIQRPAAPSPPINQDDPARRVFNELIETKKKLNESTAGLTYESVQKSMQAQTEQLRQTRGAKEVDFKVVVKDGKAFLKPQTK